MDVQLTKAIRNAVKQGNVSQLRTLFTMNESAVIMTTTFGTWLHVASQWGQLDAVKLLVEHYGLDVNSRGGVASGNALHRAATDGHYDVVKYLLDHGAEMDTSEPERNPLFGAILSGNIEIGKLLIERGIDTQVRYTGERMKNLSALDFAKERGAADFVTLLGGT